jgi:hypothetical protein
MVVVVVRILVLENERRGWRQGGEAADDGG